MCVYKINNDKLLHILENIWFKNIYKLNPGII